jgi:uncharacterized membrane protein YcaP (DUF421 family)
MPAVGRTTVGDTSTDRRLQMCHPRGMTFETLWGAGRDLDALQMATRAFVMFFVALVLIRISGRRSFARHTAFDNIVVIILGAVLSRPIYGASPFWPVVAGSTTFVVVHRLIGLVTSRFPTLERVVKGRPYLLWRDGVLHERAMLRNELSRGDLDAAVRLQMHRPGYTDVAEIHVETSGELSIVDRDL